MNLCRKSLVFYLNCVFECCNVSISIAIVAEFSKAKCDVIFNFRDVCMILMIVHRCSGNFYPYFKVCEKLHSACYNYMSMLSLLEYIEDCNGC